MDRGDANAPDGEDRHSRIAQRAYQLYLARGSSHGSDWEDWLIAEREVVGSSEAGHDE